MAFGPDYTSTEAKLTRAKEHIDVLDHEISVWLISGSHVYTIERNEDYTQYYFRAKLNGPKPDLLRWTIIAGDAINNMRAALDHAIYAIAKHETAHDTAIDIENLAFIIVDSPSKWADRNNRKRIAALSTDVKRAIERLQPFNRPHPILPPVLKILRDFSNADKHRLLRLAAAAISSGNVGFTSPFRNTKKIGVNTEPIEDGEIFAVVEAPQPEPDLTFESAQFTIEIALWHGLKAGSADTMQQRSPAIVLLNVLMAEVRFAVMELKSAVS